MTALVLGLAQCDWSTEPVQKESLVVEAFFDTGQSLPPIILRRTVPLRSSPESAQDAVSGAQVNLRLGDASILYYESPARADRYRPRQDTVVPPNVSWELTATWRGDTARATGRAPPSIQITRVCVEVPASPVQAVRVDSVRRDSLDIPADQGYIYPVDVRVRWKQNLTASGADTLSWVRAQLRPDAAPFSSPVVEFFLEPADIRREGAFATGKDARRWTGVYAVPVDSGTAPLPRHNLTTTLTRGDSSFASFARTRTDPDRREPVSNIDGGLGIALSVSVDSLVQTVEPGGEQCQTDASERALTASSGGTRGQARIRSFDHFPFDHARRATGWEHYRH